MEPLTLALPKGRLFDQVQEFFGLRGLKFGFNDRKLTALDESGLIKIILVKNSDLPTYVNHGIAGLGVCGDDVLYESGWEFTRLRSFDFGGTTLSLAAQVGYQPQANQGPMTIATKFTRFTRDFFHQQGIPVKIIKLDGSVELAPILGLAPYIVDLVETGSTLKANGLEVIDKLKPIQVQMIANPAYYKLHYNRIHDLIQLLEGVHQ